MSTQSFYPPEKTDPRYYSWQQVTGIDIQPSDSSDTVASPFINSIIVGRAAQELSQFCQPIFEYTTVINPVIDPAQQQAIPKIYAGFDTSFRHLRQKPCLTQAEQFSVFSLFAFQGLNPNKISPPTLSVLDTDHVPNKICYFAMKIAARCCDEQYNITMHQDSRYMKQLRQRKVNNVEVPDAPMKRIVSYRFNRSKCTQNYARFGNVKLSSSSFFGTTENDFGLDLIVILSGVLEDGTSVDLAFTESSRILFDNSVQSEHNRDSLSVNSSKKHSYDLTVFDSSLRETSPFYMTFEIPTDQNANLAILEKENSRFVARYLKTITYRSFTFLTELKSVIAELEEKIQCREFHGEDVSRVQVISSGLFENC